MLMNVSRSPQYVVQSQFATTVLAATGVCVRVDIVLKMPVGCLVSRTPVKVRFHKRYYYSSDLLMGIILVRFEMCLIF